MDFLDKLVLPQSLEHITLLHFLTVVVMMLFIPFISIIFGGTIISLYYKRKSVQLKSAWHAQFAREVIELTTVNKSAGVGLGIAPVLMLVMTFSQLFTHWIMLPSNFLCFHYLPLR